ncbi:MAG: response regulator transcription factor [Acidimicrobiia bacterium]
MADAPPTMRALVCDDDPLTRQVVSDLLTDNGFDVLAELETAPPVIELARSIQPEVVVLDVSLMGMTGIEAIPAVREAAPDCSIIVFSAFDSVRSEALAAGAAAVVDKTQPDELQRVLAEIVRERNASRQ